MGRAGLRTFLWPRAVITSRGIRLPVASVRSLSSSLGTPTTFLRPHVFPLPFRGRYDGQRRRRRGALDADFEGGHHVRVQPQFDLVLAQGTGRGFEGNLPLLERDVELSLELVGDRTRGDRAEHLAVVASLDRDDADELGDALGQVVHRVELVRLALGPALLERFNAALVGPRQRNGQSLWEQIIAGVAGGHFYLVGLATETDDVVRQNNFSFCHTVNRDKIRSA